MSAVVDVLSVCAGVALFVAGVLQTQGGKTSGERAAGALCVLVGAGCLCVGLNWALGALA